MRWIDADRFDRLAGSDPGLNRLRSALQSVIAIAAILVAERLFVAVTHALQLPAHAPGGGPLPPAAAAQVAVANHEFLVIAMMLGAIIGLICSIGVTDTTPRGQLVTLLLVPLPMIAALSFGLEIGGHRVLALTSLAVILSVGTYLRRFGPRGFIAGMLLFMGDFFGFFLHGAVTLSDLGWLAAEIGVALLVATAVRFALFYPRPAQDLRRTQRSYTARARKVAALALELFNDPAHSEAEARRLHRHLVRLNEAALMIDAQLGDAGAVADGSSGQLLHQRLFDVEVALTNLARFAPSLARLDLPPAHRAPIRAALRAIADDDAPAAKSHAHQLLDLLRDAGRGARGSDDSAVVIAHRFAGSVIDLADAITDWTALGVSADGEKGSFQPAVMLFGGWLPGSAQVSAAASMEPGPRTWERFTLAPYTRTAIQMGVAVGAAIVLGDLLSGRRFYWAVIAAFITFMGANNSGEQARKAGFRVVGTIVGIGIGSLVVRIVGHHTNWSIAVILTALFLGFYLMRINYAFMVIGITVMVSQLYVQLDEFSNSLLLLRLEETGIGAAVAILVVTFVLPLRTRRVLRIALRAHVGAVGTLVDHATDRLLETGGTGAEAHQLRADARAVDATFQALVATNVPLRRSPLSSVEDRTAGIMRLAAAARNYARNLVSDVELEDRLDSGTRARIERGRSTLTESLDTVASALTGPRDKAYVRSASLFDEAERAVQDGAGGIHPALLAIRDLTLIDGAMATLAQTLRLDVVDSDTTVTAGDLEPSPV
jgi:uncharacterized membrane protein YgaE (UPF0421/DUF939 family)